MRATTAVLYEFNQPLAVEEVDVLDPQAGEVLVRLAASGVCHSDLHVIDGLMTLPLPVVLGHEAAGIVEAVGPGVTSVRSGDHVILTPVPNCGRCYYCTIGRPNLCATRGLRAGKGSDMADGTTRFRNRNGQPLYHFASVSSFSTYTVVSEDGAIKVRDDAPLDKVCLIGCGVMTGVGAALNAAKVRPGSRCVVIGCGGVGLNVVQGCAIAGAEMIIAVDILDLKLEMARTFGATHTINGGQEDVVARVRALTGDGADYSFEAISTVPTIRQAWSCLRPGGMCVVVGMAPPGSEVPISVNSLLLGERVLTGTYMGGTRPRSDVPMLVDLYMSGKLKLEELISRTLPIEAINTAFDLMRSGEVARSVIVY